MKAYFDSSALIAAYVNETHSDRARTELAKHIPVPWTLLHDVEVRNALRLLHGRALLDGDELQELLAHVDEDLAKGRLERPALGLEEVFLRAERLSDAHTSRTLARTLDILHVAAAVELGCTSLVSGDARQIALARAERLRAVYIHARPAGEPRRK